MDEVKIPTEIVLKIYQLQSQADQLRAAVEKIREDSLRMEQARLALQQEMTALAIRVKNEHGVDLTRAIIKEDGTVSYPAEPTSG